MKICTSACGRRHVREDREDAALKRALLIINPSASGVTARNRVVIQNALAAAFDLSVAETNRRGHATRLAQGAPAAGLDVVIGLGGDGTVNEVANGLARGPVAMAVLPGGSTNVFARTIGMVNEPVAAVEQLVTAVAQDRVKRVGLGNVNGRFFCFHVGMGFDAAVVGQVERHGSLKRWLGHPLFIYAAFVTWARHYDRRTPAFSIALPDGRTMEGLFAIAMNTNPYTFLGPRPLSLLPGTGLDDPLGLVNIRTLGLLGTVRATVAAARGGDRLGRLRHVDVVERVESFVVTGHRPFPWQVDGDHLGDTLRLEFHHEPDVLSLVVP